MHASARQAPAPTNEEAPNVHPRPHGGARCDNGAVEKECALAHRGAGVHDTLGAQGNTVRKGGAVTEHDVRGKDEP